MVNKQAENNTSGILFFALCSLCYVLWDDFRGKMYARGDGFQTSDRAYHHQAAPKIESRMCVERR